MTRFVKLSESEIALAAKADLVGGKIPAEQLPSFVDDILEFANLAAFPATGEDGKLYIAIDTNKTYRWGGTAYGPVGSDTALGETPLTAYRGDRGKIAYDHSQATGNPHGTTIADIGGLESALNSKGASKTVLAVTGNISIAWQTDLVPSSTLTYAQKHGNIMPSIEGVYLDGTSYIFYKPGYNYSLSGSNIATLNITEVFTGFISII